jgi:hypothetical protein
LGVKLLRPIEQAMRHTGRSGRDTDYYLACRYGEHIDLIAETKLPPPDKKPSLELVDGGKPSDQTA